MSGIGQSSQDAFGFDGNRSIKNGSLNAKRARAAILKMMFFWAAVSAALFVFCVPPCPAAEKPAQNKEKKEWRGRLKYGKKLNLEDLAELTVVMKNGSEKTLKDFKEWSAELIPYYWLIKFDLDQKAIKFYGRHKKWQENLAKFLNDKITHKVVYAAIKSWKGSLKNGKAISSEDTKEWHAMLWRTKALWKVCPPPEDCSYPTPEFLAYFDSIYQRDLNEIVKKHELWDQNYKDPEADFPCLSGADLSDAYLKSAYLVNANLKGAELVNVNMNGANLGGANLEGASLFGAKLEGANLSYAVLKKAYLVSAKLRGADLTGVDLSDADLADAEMSRAVFESLKELPPALNMLDTKNLWQMIYKEHSYSLIQMRNEFKQAGLPSYARQLNHASKHNKGGVSWHSYLTYWLLEWPSDWGGAPLKPIFLMLICAGVFSIAYWTFAIPGVESCAVHWIKGNEEKPFDKGSDFDLLYAILFSLICALRFGWRWVEKGTWLTDAMPKELLLKPVGWCRPVYGLQSLISKYMIFLFLANYFGGLFRD